MCCKNRKKMMLVNLFFKFFSLFFKNRVEHLFQLNHKEKESKTRSMHYMLGLTEITIF